MTTSAPRTSAGIYTAALAIAVAASAWAIANAATPIVSDATGELLALVLVVTLVARWALQRSVALALGLFVALLGVAHAVAHSPGAVFGFALTSVAAAAIGARWLPRPPSLSPTAHLVLSYSVGLVLIAGVMNVIIRTKISSAALDAGLIGLAAFACRAALREALVRSRREIAACQLLNSAERWSFALLLGVAAAAMSAALLPSIASDDLGYHLRMATILGHYGRYIPDVRELVWAVAPCAGDLIHALATWLSSGDDGVRGLQASSYLFAAAFFLYRWLVGSVSRAAAFLLVALFLSTPILLWLGTSLQTEALGTLWTSAAFFALLNGRDWPLGLRWRAVCLLLAGMCALKSAHFPLAAAFGLYLVFDTAWRDRAGRNLAAILPALLIAAFIALQPYYEAWALTGNPVFPLFNGYFKAAHSPPSNFSNFLYSGKFGPGLWWRMLFDTRHYYETPQSIGGGVQYFALLLPALCLSVRASVTGARRAVLLAVAFALPVLLAQQYYRYIVPVLPLLSLALAAPLASQLALSAGLRRAVFATLLGCLTVNLIAMPGISWTTGSEYLKRSLDPEKRRRMIEVLTPDRLANEWISRSGESEPRVMYLDHSFGANLVGTPLYTEWYNMAVSDAVDGLHSEAEFSDLLQKLGVDYLVSPLLPAGHATSRNHLAAYLAHHATLLAQFGALGVYRPAFEDRWPDRLLETARFDANASGWEGFGKARIENGEAVGMGADSWIRRVPIVGYRRLRLELTGRCPPDADGRLLVRLDFETDQKWLGHRESQLHCTNENTTVFAEFLVPPRATRAVVILSGAYTENFISRVQLDGQRQ